jgi:hypothetical protein
MKGDHHSKNSGRNHHRRWNPWEQPRVSPGRTRRQGDCVRTQSDRFRRYRAFEWIGADAL